MTVVPIYNHGMSYVENLETPHHALWATPTRELIPDVFVGRQWSPVMLGGYEQGKRKEVDAGKSPFFRPNRYAGDWESWVYRLWSYDEALRFLREPLGELRVNEKISGRQLGYQLAYETYIQRTTVPISELNQLVDFSNCEHNPMGMRRMAKRISSFLTPEETQKDEISSSFLTDEWKKIRRQLGLGTLRGANALSAKLMQESSEETRKEIYNALHCRDRELAEIILEKRRLGLQKSKNTSLNISSGVEKTSENSVTTFLHQIYQQVSESSNVLNREKRRIKHNMFKHLDCELPWNHSYVDNAIDELIYRPMKGLRYSQSARDRVASILGLRDLATLFQVKHSREGEMAYNPNLPFSVFAGHGIGRTFRSIRNKWHEWGHALHSTNVDGKFLPYVLRAPDSISAEIMGIDGQNLIYEPKILQAMGITPASLDWLESLRIVDLTRSIAGSIARHHWEQWFYNEQNFPTLESASQYFEMCMNDIGTTPDSPFAWANDLYLGQYKLYSKNYVLAYYANEQVRTFAQYYFGEPYAEAAMWWKHERLWWPGGALSWRDLIQHATGAEFSAEPLNSSLQALDAESFFRSLNDCE